MSIAEVEERMAAALVGELDAAIRGLDEQVREDRRGLALSTDTKRRLDELFAGKLCGRCGAQAVRLVGGTKFYFGVHFLRRVIATREPRVHRCSAA